METTKQYKDHTIALTDDMTFEVTGKHFDGLQPRQRQFAAVVDARVAIDKAIEDHLKANSKELLFEARVVTDKGIVAVATSIDRRTGGLNVDGIRYVYPAVDWLTEAVKRRALITNELLELNRKIDPFQMNITRSFSPGRVDSVSSLATYRERFLAQYAEKLKEANEPA